MYDVRMAVQILNGAASYVSGGMRSKFVRFRIVSAGWFDHTVSDES